MGFDNSPLATPGATFSMTIAAGSGSRTSAVVDLAGYVNATAFFTSFGSGGNPNIALQFSADLTTWYSPAQSFDYNAGNAWTNYGSFSQIGGISGSANSILAAFPIYGRYARLQTTATTTGNPYTLQLTAYNGPLPPSQALYQKVQGTANPGDAYVPGLTGIQAHGLGYGYVGGASTAWNRLRTPNIFKTGLYSTSGGTVWTPTSGYRFRLMRYKISISNNASLASANEQTIQFQDNGANTGIAETGHVPGAAPGVAGNWGSGWVDLGNGYLSTGINQALTVSITWNFTTGGVRVTVCGTEE